MGGWGYAEDSAADTACCESAVRGGGGWGRAAEKESRVLSSFVKMGLRKDRHIFLSQKVKDGNL